MTEHDADPRAFEQARKHLVDRLIRQGTLREPRVIRAFESTPRHLFVPEAGRNAAYEDRALPLAEGQTISQPSMIAIMLEQLDCRPTDTVLEVGSGSGYAAALLSHLASEVHGVELLPRLVERSRQALRQAGASNVTIHQGDGTLGLPAYAPFERIVVSAGAERVPDELAEQLADGGRLVIPVGGYGGQILRVGERHGDSLRWMDSVPCMFVPLIRGEPTR